MELRLACRGDGEELIDTKRGGACAFDGQPNTALPSMPLVYDICTGLLIML